MVLLFQVGDQDAVVIVEKTPITEDTLTELFSGSRLALDMKNDIYSTYRLQPPAHLNGSHRRRPGGGDGDSRLHACLVEMKVTVVCPATEKHVKKYQRQESYLVEETAEDYRSITLPYIEAQSFSLQVGLGAFARSNVTTRDSAESHFLPPKSGCTTSWRRRRRLRGSCTKIQTRTSALFSSRTSSGTRNR